MPALQFGHLHAAQHRVTRATAHSERGRGGSSGRWCGAKVPFGPEHQALAQRYLEPNAHGPGWLLVDDEVAGRLVWGEGRERGESYDVVVDGRTLSWEELGHALGSYEGWQFRLVMEDPALDVRPDAEVVAFPAQSASSCDRAPEEEAAGPSIDDVLSEFLAAQEQRLGARTFAHYRSVVDLLRHCLNGYGHQHLDDDERRRYEPAFDAGDEDAFVHLFGPDKIVEGLGEFLDYFMVRKVMAGEELLRAAGTVTKKLAKWMAASGHLDARSSTPIVGQIGHGHVPPAAPNRRNLESLDKNRCRTTPTAS